MRVGVGGGYDVVGEGEDGRLDKVLLGVVVLDEVLDVLDLVGEGEPVAGGGGEVLGRGDGRAARAADGRGGGLLRDEWGRRQRWVIAI